MIAPTVTAKRAKGRGGPAGDECQNIVFDPRQDPCASVGVSRPLGAKDAGLALLAFDCKRNPEARAVAPTLRSMGHDASHPNAGGQIAVLAVDRKNARTRGTGVGFPLRESEGRSGTSGQGILAEGIVRRFTPLESERLMGFPDDWTAIQWRRRRAPDGPRYAALGNSMAVPVVRWIGERIAAVEEAISR